MLFNSFEFALFLPLVFCLYWFGFSKNITLQNLFILGASLVFYGWWDWRFLFLLLLSSSVDYFLSIQIVDTEDPRKRKLFLTITLISNLGILCIFKYFNFFSSSLNAVLHTVGFQADFITLNVILPVGVSFYTFQTMSYTIDIYNRKFQPTRNLLSYFSFVSFFPQLVAGPIERAKDLLPQFYVRRSFDRAKAEDGLRQMLWGFFKKIVIADNCSVYVDNIYHHYQTMDASYLLLGAFYFAFQIYGDFSGYSDIAIGSARLFGFNLNQNFAFPYFSRDIAEFWRRWHISLSSWFRDYVYIPLGGSRVGDVRKVINVLAIFLISGLWHGANWTYVTWGLINGLYFLPLMLFTNHKSNTVIVAEHSILPTPKEVLGILLTFSLTLIAWIFFRSATLSIAFDFIYRMFSPTIFNMPATMKSMLPLIAMMVVIEWFMRRKQHGLQLENVPPFLRWGIYIVLIGFIAYFSSDQDIAFIYFQF